MFEDEYLDSKVLIVDDEPANVRLLERILQREGFRHIESTNDPRHFLALYAATRPDILLLDLHMPVLDGFAVMEQLKGRIATDDFVPILVLTADITPAARQRALAGGAKDFLTKPVDPAEVVLRIRNLLQTRYYYRQLQNQNQTLERKVSERTRELEQAQIEILERLARAAEYRDDETGHHAQRVGHIAALIARRLELSDTDVVLIRRAAPLHDVGKIGIPDSILLKPGKLTKKEFDEMKKHTAIGAGILSGSKFPVLQMAEEIALYHHENWDGSGYMKMEGDLIPLSAQVVHAADVFDALIHERPYKRAWTTDEALDEIRKLAGRFFDPRIADAVLAVHADGRLAIEGPPPPVADLFRTDRGEDIRELAARAAKAEARAQGRDHSADQERASLETSAES
ncbi:MAG TPA: HD domain-containing phosphohydrolase [Longimicrobiales bacterium]|nr:HD domain-containing phosphohydrolase [Longimicrobiales bacterium]